MYTLEIYCRNTGKQPFHIYPGTLEECIEQSWSFVELDIVEIEIKMRGCGFVEGVNEGFSWILTLIR